MARAGIALWTMLGATLLIASCAEEKTDGGGDGGSGNTTSSGTGGTTSSGTGGTTSSGTGGTTSSGTGGTTSSGTGGSGGGTGGSGGVLAPGCGNDNVEDLEVCDNSDLAGEQCETLGFSGGTLACNANCYLWDVSGCTVAAPVCGNNIAEGLEPCDGTDMGGAEGYPCTLLGFTGGTLSCGAGCVYDTSTCTGGPAGWTCPVDYYDANDGCDCGCGILDPDCSNATVGVCDYCNDFGSCNGAADCADPNSLINGSDNSSCDAATCGNNLAEGTEPCDGTDLRGNGCTDLGMGYNGGTLACSSCALDTSGCTQPTCGDNTAEGYEWCDGTDLPVACDDLPYYDGGTVGCDSNCNLDTSGCTMPVCGDNTATGGEYCDGTDLGPLDTYSCQDLGFTGGSWSCGADCRYDLSGCTGGTPGWTCPESFYGDGECDCGCGVVDSDCGDPSVFACAYCNDVGSCTPLGTLDCPATIDPNDNSQCL